IAGSSDGLAMSTSDSRKYGNFSQSDLFATGPRLPYDKLVYLRHCELLNNERNYLSVSFALSSQSEEKHNNRNEHIACQHPSTYQEQKRKFWSTAADRDSNSETFIMYRAQQPSRQRPCQHLRWSQRSQPTRLLEDGGCDYDVLIVAIGTGDDEKIHGPFCRSQNPRDFKFNQTVWVNFQSDQSNSEKGFVANFGPECTADYKTIFYAPTDSRPLFSWAMTRFVVSAKCQLRLFLAKFTRIASWLSYTVGLNSKW
ncbi:hypothetical protein CLF_112997, partial [Clonorchis sinensis]